MHINATQKNTLSQPEPETPLIQFDKARSTTARDDSILNKSRNPVANLFNAHNGYVTKVFKFSILVNTARYKI